MEKQLRHHHQGEGVYQLCKELGVGRLPLSFRSRQLQTGHGNLAAYLRRMGLRRAGLCICGKSEEDSRHVGEECEEERDYALVLSHWDSQGQWRVAR